nr:hypothetical protein [Tanacetum cinerariifolium]
MIVFLSKPSESEGFELIIDFLNANPIKDALTVNLTVYTSCIEQFWTTAKAKNINGEAQIHAKVDEKMSSSLKHQLGEILGLEMKEELIVSQMKSFLNNLHS